MDQLKVLEVYALHHNADTSAVLLLSVGSRDWPECNFQNQSRDVPGRRVCYGTKSSKYLSNAHRAALMRFCLVHVAE